MKRLVFAVTVAAMLAVAGVAHAAFFDDEGGVKWWMAADQWTAGFNNGASITEFDNKLGVTAGPGSGAFYFSNWTIDSTKSFSFSVDYNYNLSNQNTGAIIIGVGPITNTYDDGLKMYAGNIAGVGGYMFQDGLNDPVSLPIPRTSSNGTLSATYIAGLEPSLVLSSGGFTIPYDLTGKIEGDEFLRVYIGGGSMDAAFTGDSAYLTNFMVTNGVPTPGVAPEPVSSALFLVGGAVLAARRIKRGKKA